jgi:hypothetical protein
VCESNTPSTPRRCRAPVLKICLPIPCYFGIELLDRFPSCGSASQPSHSEKSTLSGSYCALNVRHDPRHCPSGLHHIGDGTKITGWPSRLLGDVLPAAPTAMEPRRPVAVFGCLDRCMLWPRHPGRWNQRRAPAFSGAWMEHVPDAADRDGTKKTGGGFWALGSADGIWKRSRCGSLADLKLQNYPGPSACFDDFVI